MNKITWKFVGATLVVILTSGCTAEPPKCADEQTILLVKKILIENIVVPEGMGNQEINESLKFTFPLATAYDDKIKKLDCEAKIDLADKFEIPVTYYSQLDDNGQHIVTVGGMKKSSLSAIEVGLSMISEKNDLEASQLPPGGYKLSEDEVNEQLAAEEAAEATDHNNKPTPQ